MIAGADLEMARARFEGHAAAARKSVLFHEFEQRITAAAFIEDFVAALARVTLDLWPVWFGDADFSAFGTDITSREALRIEIEALAKRFPTLMSGWARRAAALASEGKAPHVQGAPAEIEIDQLCLLIDPRGLALVTNMGLGDSETPAAFVAALEWIARSANIAVVVLCNAPPPNVPPFDRLLPGARIIARDDDRQEERAAAETRSGTWIAPIVGRPHPMSVIEQRLAKLLASDPELAPLFAFNQPVETVRNGCFLVDLVWYEGRVVIELDGYPDHNTRTAFARDRHRDYELMLTGYLVLRIANDEIIQDFGKAVEKIRDVVRFRRPTPSGDKL